jgi:hypothetical protein
MVLIPKPAMIRRVQDIETHWSICATCISKVMSDYITSNFHQEDLIARYEARIEQMYIDFAKKLMGEK